MVEIVCPVCGRVFEGPKCKRYCCESCYKEARLRRKREWARNDRAEKQPKYVKNVKRDSYLPVRNVREMV